MANLATTKILLITRSSLRTFRSTTCHFYYQLPRMLIWFSMYYMCSSVLLCRNFDRKHCCKVCEHQRKAWLQAAILVSCDTESLWIDLGSGTILKIFCTPAGSFHHAPNSITRWTDVYDTVCSLSMHLLWESYQVHLNNISLSLMKMFFLSFPRDKNDGRNFLGTTLLDLLLQK